MSNERDLILHAALDEFAERGINAQSLEGVARNSSLDVRAVRALFPDEKSLLLEVLQVITDPIVSAVSVAVENTAEPRDLLEKSIEIMDNWLLENPQYVKLVLQCMAADPAVLMVLYQRSLYPSEFIERFERFAAEGKIRQKDVTMVMVLLDSLMFFPHLTTSFLGADGKLSSPAEFLERRRQAIMDLFEGGLLADRA